MFVIGGRPAIHEMLDFAEANGIHSRSEVVPKKANEARYRLVLAN